MAYEADAVILRDATQQVYKVIVPDLSTNYATQTGLSSTNAAVTQAQSDASTALANAAAASAAASNAQATADGKIVTFYQSTAPTAAAVGDLWVRSTDRQLFRWDGSAWGTMQDTGIATAITDASNAQATADGKITTFYATSAPTAEGVGDLWVNTAANNKLSRWSGSAWVDLDVTTNTVQTSKGGDLVTNGSGLLGNNYNFSTLTYDGTDAPAGANGSFKNSTDFFTALSDEYIAVDPNRKYKVSVKVRQQVAGIASNFYAGIAPFDAYNNSIDPTTYCYDTTAETTLAAPLNTGATTVSLTAGGAAWATGTYNYIGLWNYTDPGGRVWPQHTYTRLVQQYASITGTTVTLSAPWAGPSMPAGTLVNRMWPGSGYMYCAAVNVTPSTTWTAYSGTVTGNFNGASTGPNAASNSFPPGTAKMKPLALMNRDVGGGTHAIAAVSINEASAAQADATTAIANAAAAQSTANAAQTSANGKNTVFYQTTAPTANAVNDLWFDTDDGNKPYRWSGSAWVAQPYGDAAIANLDAGKITAGVLQGITVKTANTGAYIAMEPSSTADRISFPSGTTGETAAAYIQTSSEAGTTPTLSIYPGSIVNVLTNASLNITEGLTQIGSQDASGETWVVGTVKIRLDVGATTALDLTNTAGTFNVPITATNISDAWTSYTPVLKREDTGATLASSNASGRYQRVGRTVHVQGNITTTNAITAGWGAQVSLPVTMVSTGFVQGGMWVTSSAPPSGQSGMAWPSNSTSIVVVDFTAARLALPAGATIRWNCIIVTA